MRKFIGLVILLAVLVLAALFAPKRSYTVVDTVKAEYEIAKYRRKIHDIDRNADFVFYSTLLLIACGGIGFIIFAMGRHRAEVTRASVHVAKIGASEIPVHVKQIESGDLSEQMTALANAEVLKQSNAGIDKAMQIYMAMADLEIKKFRVMASQYHHTSAMLPPGEQSALPLPSVNMSDLIRQGSLTIGQPISFGNLTACHGDIISLGVAGWQGSGKTNAMGYLSGAFVASADADVYVIDPHKEHPESLSTLLQPLEATGRVHLLSPFDTPTVIEKLDSLLNDRLSGKLSSSPPVVLVIDELPRLSRFPVFDQLVQFLVRCVTETRKAGITFIGGSHIWTGKYFNGKAEIRQCLNSMLILPIKPHQAELLLEDSQEKKMVKALNEPGKGVLSLNMHEPEFVKMPKCTIEDMREIASRLTTRAPIIDIDANTILTRDELIAGRKRLNLSQSDFGAKVGLTQKQVSRLENGEIDMSTIDSDTLDRILDTLDGVDTTKIKHIDFTSKAHAVGV